MDSNQLETLAGILVPIGAIVSVFTFITIMAWLGNRQKEREAFYKAETLRRVTESSGEGAKAAVDLLREDERIRRIKSREGLKISALINIGVGLGLVFGLSQLIGQKVALAGLVPAFFGAAMLIYIYLLAAPLE
ncbi:MAG TPA: hypothetical protein VGF01_05725 [Terracidiphilus sp.]